MQARPNFIVSLSDASAGLSQVGGKGASLARLAAAGLPVPPGFHIATAAYRRFVMEHGLQERILAAVSPPLPISLQRSKRHPAGSENSLRRVRCRTMSPKRFGARMPGLARGTRPPPDAPGSALAARAPSRIGDRLPW